MIDQPNTAIGCGFIQGFHRDDMVAPILRLKPEQRGKWLHPDTPPANGQRVKVQIWTSDNDWAILTDCINDVEDNTLVATVSRTTENEAIHDGPYRVILRYDPSMQSPWVLTHAELICDSLTD